MSFEACRRMKVFCTLFYCLAAAHVVRGGLDVSAFRGPAPASFQRAVRQRLAARPDLAAILASFVLDDAGVVSGFHYYDPKVREFGEFEAYQFCAMSKYSVGPSTLIVTVRFMNPTETRSPVRIDVSVADATPQELEKIKTMLS